MIDVETTELKHGEIPRTLFWGLATENGDYRSFDSTDELCRYLFSLPEPLDLLHHTNYDVIQMLLDGANVKLIRNHSGKLIWSKIGQHNLFNSYAMFPCPLSTIFGALGKSKTGLDDLRKRNYEDCVYGLRGCIVLDETFQRLCGESPLERHTIASTSFNSAVARAGKMPIDLAHEQSRRGGRVEVFSTNEVLADKYDINSSYSFSFLDAPPIVTLLHCLVKTDEWYGPFFDAGNPDSLTFPNGSFETWIFDDVLQRYIEPVKASITILERIRIDMTWIKACCPLITEVYQTKMKSAKYSAEEIVAKFFLNSLYGRLALKGYSDRARILNYVPWRDNNVAVQLGWDKWLVWDTITYTPKANFPFASYITCNARGRWFQQARRCSADYGDTDSLVISSGIPPVTVSPLIGDWKFEGSEVFKANNLKDYYWGSVRSVKGARLDSEGKTISTQWTLKRAVKGLPVVTLEKDYSMTLQKRLMLDNGSTQPLQVNYEHEH